MKSSELSYATPAKGFLNLSADATEHKASALSSEPLNTTVKILKLAP